jgi:hypothetical protein
MFDIYTFDLSVKMPFFLKRGQLTELLKRGIHFEINYSSAIEGQKSFVEFFKSII